LVKTLDERDFLRDKLNDAADKFETTFTKQEDAYESQYIDMKQKHKLIKAKLVEERIKFDQEINKIKSQFSNSVNKNSNDVQSLKSK